MNKFYLLDIVLFLSIFSFAIFTMVDKDETPDQSSPVKLQQSQTKENTSPDSVDEKTDTGQLNLMSSVILNGKSVTSILELNQ